MMKNKTDKEPIKVFTKRIALELRRCGFRIIGTEPNINRPEFDVYLFENTDECYNAFQELVHSHKY